MGSYHFAYNRIRLHNRLGMHKIQDFQESCLGLVLKARQDQDKTVILKIKIKTRSKMSRPRQDKISSKISRNLDKSLENIDELIFLRKSTKKFIGFKFCL